MLLESYFADLEEIEAEIKTFKEMIEDTNQFISAHLDSVRNKMIRMSLFMEMGALALGSGAVVGGIFGRAAKILQKTELPGKVVSPLPMNPQNSIRKPQISFF